MFDDVEADNDGYYQQVDDDRYCDLDDENLIDLHENTKKPRFEASHKDQKYFDIHDKLMNVGTILGSRSYARRFCAERQKIHDARAASFNIDKENWLKTNPPKTQRFCQCRNCGGGFVARLADLKRGWAKYCSKSCKAQM